MKGQLPVISNGHPEREGTQAGHSGAGHIIHHPINVLLQEDGHVTGQKLEWLPVLNDGGIGKDPPHQVGGQIQPLDSCMVKTHQRTVRGGGGQRGLDVSTHTKLRQSELEILSSEAHQQNTLWNNSKCTDAKQDL